MIQEELVQSSHIQDRVSMISMNDHIVVNLLYVYMNHLEFISLKKIYIYVFRLFQYSILKIKNLTFTLSEVFILYFKQLPYSIFVSQRNLL